MNISIAAAAVVAVVVVVVSGVFPNNSLIS
jgi:hypothetical protein